MPGSAHNCDGSCVAEEESSTEVSTLCRKPSARSEDLRCRVACGRPAAGTSPRSEVRNRDSEQTERGEALDPSVMAAVACDFRRNETTQSEARRFIEECSD